MAVDGIYGFIGAKYVLAPGSKVMIGPIPGINAANIKYDSFGSSGVVEVSSFAQTISASAMGFSAISGGATCLSLAGPTFGNGYPIGYNEIFCANLQGSIYLYCTTETCTISIAYGRSQGFQGT